MENLVWKTGDLAVVLSVSTATLCFCIYWFVAHSKRVRTLVNIRFKEGHFDYYGAFYQKATGIVLLGVAPALVAIFFLPGTWTQYGLGVTSWEPFFYWVLFLGGLLVIIPRYSARQKEMLAFYPQVRVPLWSRKLLVVNAVVWIIYLFAYEFMFRGFLLLNVASVMGWWPAITITTAICALTHFPKGSKETFGTFPLSVLLCLIVIQTGSIWACVVIHAILAIANDYWALTYHPELHLMPGESRRRQMISES